RKKHDRPIFKAAHLNDAFYIGEEHLDALSELKSKDEIISEIITLLQSPAKNVISSLKSGSSKLSGIVKTLAERTE
ncbi:MAG: 50S ribosomal protein L10, partial [Flavobacteriales bacterium]|nr:50S ribosomal protein L10 [Flavobacteriales bacterium]